MHIRVSVNDVTLEADIARLAREVDMPNIITTLRDRSGRWASDQFKDGSVTMLDWTRQTERIEPQMEGLRRFADAVRREKADGKTTDVVIIGIGGSIEGTKALLGLFGVDKASPCIHYIDTVDPIAISDVIKEIDMGRTRLIAITKSFTTLEIVSIYKVFLAAAEAKGISKEDIAGRVTIITDEKTDVSDKEKYEIARSGIGKEIFRIPTGTGGRFSWDTPVSLLPSLIMGHDVDSLRAGSSMMEDIAVTRTDIADNPAAHLALFKYLMLKNGRDKTTLLLPGKLRSSGTWTGQLEMESLCKDDGGMVVKTILLDHEPIAEEISEYGKDRVFLMVKLGEKDTTYDKLAAKLRKAGYPVYEIAISSGKGIGLYFKMLEFATIFTGYLLGIDPVNQPNVQLYKKKQLEYVSKREDAPADNIVSEGPIAVDYNVSMGPGKVTKARLEEVLKKAGGRTPSDVAAALLFIAVKDLKRDYIVQMIFRRMDVRMKASQERWRRRVRKALKTVTLGEEAPCVLHAKQQGFQTVADDGFFLFIRIMDYGKCDIAVPGLGYTLGKLVQAQARGSLEGLAGEAKPSGNGRYKGVGIRVDLKDASPATQAAFEKFLDDMAERLEDLAA
ncbi:MAG: hypothetical protein WC515_07505 [Candidatus Omnitrophota bacterium]